jgi:hypothetical protein
VSRACTVCAHPDVFEINERLVGMGGKRSNRSIAKQYGVGHSAVQRHREHIPKLLLQASQAEEIAQADTLLQRVEELFTEARGVLEAAKGDEDYPIVLAGIDRAHKQLELLAKLQGQLAQEGSPITNILVHPEFIEARTLIIEALRPFPEAKGAVVKALAGGDGNGRH